MTEYVPESCFGAGLWNFRFLACVELITEIPCCGGFHQYHNVIRNEEGVSLSPYGDARFVRIVTNLSPTVMINSSTSRNFQTRLFVIADIVVAVGKRR